MEKPLVSVIIPTFNSEKFIDKTIESVINQTYTNWEMLIIDDGSFDNTRSIVLPYVSKDKRIKYFLLDNNSGKPAVPRNYGLKNARGEYISFIDADDIWFSDKLSIQIEYLKQNPDVGLVCCHLRIKSSDKRYDNTLIAKRDKRQSGHVYNQLLSFNFIACSSVLTRVSVFSDSGYFDECPEMIAAEDWDLWLRISRNYKIVFLPEVMGIYSIHNNNISDEEARLKRVLYVIDKHLKQGWITNQQANKARVNIYLRQGWVFVDRDIKKSRALFYKVLQQSKGNPKLYCAGILGLLLSLFPQLCRNIKRYSWDKKIKNITNLQNI